MKLTKKQLEASLRSIQFHFQAAHLAYLAGALPFSTIQEGTFELGLVLMRDRPDLANDILSWLESEESSEALEARLATLDGIEQGLHDDSNN